MDFMSSPQIQRNFPGMTVDKGLERIKTQSPPPPFAKGGQEGIGQGERFSAPRMLGGGSEVPATAPASSPHRPPRQAGGAPADDKLKSLAKQFESLLVFQMMTVMRESLPKSDLLGSFSGDMYRSMQDEALANEMTRNKGIGLADMIHRQLVRLDEKARAGQAPGGDAATTLTRSPASVPLDPMGSPPVANKPHRGQPRFGHPAPARSPESESPIAPLYQRGEGGILQGGEISASARARDAGTSAAIRWPDGASLKAVKNYEVAP